MIHPGQVEQLPPILTAASSMASLGTKVTLVSSGCMESTALYLNKHGIRHFSIGWEEYPQKLWKKVWLRIKFALLLKKVIKETSPTVIWFHGADSFTYRFLLPLEQTFVVAHVHEYHSQGDKRANPLNNLVRKAHLYIIPEVNRAWLLKFDSNTLAEFVVVPNRLPEHTMPVSDYSNETRDAFQKAGGDLRCDRFVIYQGQLSSERCIKQAIEAFKMIHNENVGFIILGIVLEKKYLNQIGKLAAGDPRIRILPYIAPPDHLRITKGCDCGLLLYAPTEINNVYCAPNKIYEFAYYGLGMVMSDYPGLRSLNNKYNIATLCDPLSPASIAQSIKEQLQRNTEERQKTAQYFLSDSPTPVELYRKVFSRISGTSENKTNEKSSHIQRDNITGKSIKPSEAPKEISV